MDRKGSLVLNTGHSGSLLIAGSSPPPPRTLRSELKLRPPPPGLWKRASLVSSSTTAFPVIPGVGWLYVGKLLRCPFLFRLFLPSGSPQLLCLPPLLTCFLSLVPGRGPEAHSGFRFPPPPNPTLSSSLFLLLGPLHSEGLAFTGKGRGHICGRRVLTSRGRACLCPDTGKDDDTSACQFCGSGVASPPPA